MARIGKEDKVIQRLDILVREIKGIQKTAEIQQTRLSERLKALQFSLDFVEEEEEGGKLNVL